jgi:hypothetical protein
MMRFQSALFLVLAVSLGLGQAPVNDECSGAIPVTIGENPGACGTFSNVGATDSMGYAATCSTMNSDVWFSFTPAATCTYQISTDVPSGCMNGTGFLTDTVVALYDSCATGSDDIACNDDGGTVGTLLSVVDTPLLNGGQTYFIRVGDFGTSISTGQFRVTISQMLSITFSSPSGTSCVQANICGGPPNGNYLFAATANPGTTGVFYGINIGIDELVNEFNFGAPFAASLDATGSAQIGEFCGLPSGFNVCSVALGFNSGFGLPDFVSQPVCYTVP